MAKKRDEARLQSVLDDYFAMPGVSLGDLSESEQKYIHYWDFMDLDDEVFEFQARLGLAIGDLSEDIKRRFRAYYTRVMVQDPEAFRFHRDMLETLDQIRLDPFFLTILQFALDKDVEPGRLSEEIRQGKQALTERRRAIKKKIDEQQSELKEFLVR